ncbi:MAG TPA: ParB/RepB/Spo0J family partition protein [Gammaproteobacteria bacterium]|nr:ParB/RepB/Spo0J family partition protein [Gammaproteobacteria bacterium]
MKKRGLGRGLDALLGLTPEAPTTGERVGDHEMRTLPVDLIQRGRYQPRLDMKTETLQELADSIKVQGVVQPVVVRRLTEQGRYELVAGERRWRAAQIAGLHDIPAIIRDIPDQAAASIALIENIQREELNALEEASAISRLVSEFSMTHQDVAEAVGRSRAAVTNLLRLLELAEPVKRMLEVGDIEMGHARALLALAMEQQSLAANQIVTRGLSVREAERLVKDWQRRRDGRKAKAGGGADPNIRKLQEELAEKLAARVELRHTKKGRGELRIHYHSLDELDGILARIK